MPVQRRFLLAYKQFQSSPLTIGNLLLRHWKVWLLMTAVSVVGVAYAFVVQNYALAWFMGGMWLGFVARDFGTCRQAARAWPTLHAIIDWLRLAQLLAMEERPKVSEWSPPPDERLKSH